MIGALEWIRGAINEGMQAPSSVEFKAIDARSVRVECQLDWVDITIISAVRA